MKSPQQDWRRQMDYDSWRREWDAKMASEDAYFRKLQHMSDALAKPWWRRIKVRFWK